MTQNVLICPDCACRNRRSNRRCWLCDREFVENANSSALQKPVAEIDRGPGKSGILAILWILAVALCLVVGWGIAQINPWFLLPFAVVAILPISAAMIGDERAITQTVGGKAYDRAESFIVSAAVTIVIAMAVAVAGFIALFVQCLYGFTPI